MIPHDLQALLSRAGSIMNITTDAKTAGNISGLVNDFLAALPDDAKQPATWQDVLKPQNEGLIVPTQVSSGSCSWYQRQLLLTLVVSSCARCPIKMWEAAGTLPFGIGSPSI